MLSCSVQSRLVVIGGCLLNGHAMHSKTTTSKKLFHRIINMIMEKYFRSVTWENKNTCFYCTQTKLASAAQRGGKSLLVINLGFRQSKLSHKSARIAKSFSLVKVSILCVIIHLHLVSGAVLHEYAATQLQLLALFKKVVDYTSMSILEKFAEILFAMSISQLG